MKWWHYILLLLSIVAALLIGLLIGMQHPLKKPIEPIKIKVDTLFIYDTITLSEPVYVEKVKLDSVLIPVVDTLRIQDTMYVYLEREQIQWHDSLCRVYASGVMPQVDSVQHFVCDKIVTIETKVPVKVKTHWGLGVNAGYGVGLSGKQVYLTPYVGVGISYNILSW